MTAPRDRRPRQKPAAPAILSELNNAMLEEARRTVKVREGGETQETSARAVVLRRLFEMINKGSPHAARTWFQLDAEALVREAAVKAEIAAFWRAYRVEARHLIATAEKQAKPPPEIIPHPDDITIDGANNVTIEGAACAEEARVHDHIARQREAFMRQHVLDERRARRRGEAQAGLRPSIAYLMAVMANSVLPKRLQLDEQEMIALHYRLRAQTKRQILKDNYRAWKQLGYASPRDAVSPGLDALEGIMPALDLIVQDLQATQGRDRDIEEALARVVRIVGSPSTWPSANR